MIPDFDLIEWAAVAGVALLLVVLAVAWLIPQTLTWWHGRRFDAETPVFERAEEAWWATHGDAYRSDPLHGYPAVSAPAPRRCRWGVGELVTAPARWLASVAMWWAGGGRRG